MGENTRKIESIGTHRQQGRGLYELLSEYKKEGCTLCLEGKEETPGYITSACLREGVNYMMDFSTGDGGDGGDGGRIRKIDFTRIADEQTPHRQDDKIIPGPGDIRRRDRNRIS